MAALLMAGAGCSNRYSIGSDWGADASSATDASGPAEVEVDDRVGLTDAEIDDLIEGGPVGDLKWLYPYAGTVFPRGILAPLAMWNGDVATDVVYLHIKSRAFEYKGILRPTIRAGVWLPFGLKDEWPAQALGAITGELATQLPIPQTVWDRAGEATGGAADPFSLALTVRTNGRIHGPITVDVIIAPGTLKGAIYYNSCLPTVQGGNPLDSLADPSASAGTLADGTSGSKVLRVRPGSSAELVLSEPGQIDQRCQGCHSVSADGSRLIAQESLLVESAENLVSGSGLTESGEGRSYRLSSDGAPEPLAGNSVGPNASYGALYPDGSKYLSSSGFTGGVGYATIFGNPFGLLQSLPATLYDATTGAVTPDTGVPEGASMPMFSPDGKYLVFNDFALGDAHGLRLMRYDTRAHKASDPRTLVEDARSSPLRPGWPFFLPDNRAVVFIRTDSPDFASGAGVHAFVGENPLTDLILAPPSSSDLYLVEVESGASVLLARAMGYASPADAARSATYLPGGAKDLHHNYFPSVSPVAAGGYFWVFFDSLRDYGNLGRQRAIWGFALDIRRDGDYALDPSHPPFYLPGQEGLSANHRAFAALDRCRADGAACASGVDCCGGRCRNGICSSPADQREPDGCARIDERCATQADCCAAQDASRSPLCIAGFCAHVPAPR